MGARPPISIKESRVIWVQLPIPPAQPNAHAWPMKDDALSVIVCGSGSAIPAYLIWLRQEVDLPLRVLMTHSAERFVPPQLVAWYADEMYVSGDPALNPTELARRSLGIVVLPATANIIAAAALGLAATPAQTALLNSPRSVMFFPSTNEAMWTMPTPEEATALIISWLEERLIADDDTAQVVTARGVDVPGGQ